MPKLINLLPDPILDTQKKFSNLYQGTAMILIGLIIFVLVNLTVLFFSIRAAGTLEDVQARALALEQEIDNLQSVESKLLVFREKIALYEAFAKNNVPIDEVVRQLTASPMVYLVGIEYQDNQTLVAHFDAPSEASMVQFLRQLDEVESLRTFEVTDVAYSGVSRQYEVNIRFLLPEQEESLPTDVPEE